MEKNSQVAKAVHARTDSLRILEELTGTIIDDAAKVSAQFEKLIPEAETLRKDVYNAGTLALKAATERISEKRFPTIRLTCSDCGDIETSGENVLVRVCVDTGQRDLAFCCPDCENRQSISLSSRQTEILIASGCNLDRWWLPIEVAEVAEGDIYNYAIDFHEGLKDDGQLGSSLAEMFRELGPETMRTYAEHAAQFDPLD